MEKILNYTIQIFNQLNIHSICIDHPSSGISNKIDLGLRNILYGSVQYIDVLQNSMSEAKDNTIYRFFDEHDCHYVFLRLPNKDSYYFVGPYLLNTPTDTMIHHKIQTLNLNESLTIELKKYYTNLPIIEDENLIFSIINALASNIWKEDNQFQMEYVEYAIPDKTIPIKFIKQENEQSESPIYLNIIEEIYANENKLMEAVSQGKLHIVNRITSNIMNKGISQRTNDSVRNRQNYLIILNTLLRKSAEYGAVHPIHIDRLSSEFALKIEHIRSIQHSVQLFSEMIREYCLLVKNHSLKQYSYLIGKALTIINYDLSSDLSLHKISDQLNINPSYLSNLFKKECGCTLTDYVTQKRIEYSVYLLSNTNKQIQTIALECGIPDTTYFIKLFKKQNGMTPSQFRKQFSNKSQ